MTLATGMEVISTMPRESDPGKSNYHIPTSTGSAFFGAANCALVLGDSSFSDKVLKTSRSSATRSAIERVG